MPQFTGENPYLINNNENYELRRMSEAFTVVDKYDAQVEKVAKLISAQWHNSFPDLIFSLVTGSTETRALKTLNQRNAFQAGIASLLLALPGMIFIYDVGSKSEIVHLVELTLSGIRTFEKYVGMGTEFATQNVNTGDTLIRLQQPRSRRSETRPMFGSDFSKAVVLRAASAADSAMLRVKLETAIWTELHQKFVNSFGNREAGAGEMEGSPIGSVVLVVHGSVDELAAIPKYVANKVPLVILSGCGGIADVLAKGLQLLGKGATDARVEEELANIMEEFFPEVGDDGVLIRTLVNLHMDVLSTPGLQEMATIVEGIPENLSNFRYFLVEAIVRTSREVPEEHVFKANLHLAIKCNQMDITKEMLFYDPTWNNYMVPYSAFELAVALQFRSAFVDLFLEDGFQVHNYLSAKMLLQMFVIALDDTNMFLKQQISRQVMGKAEDHVMTEHEIIRELNILISRLTNHSHFLELGENPTASGVVSAEAEQKARYGLAVFALLTNDMNLLHVIIKHSIDPIPLAIFSETMLRGIAECLSDQTMKTHLDGQANDLAKLALGMYDMAYDENMYRARAILLHDLPHFSGRNILRLAVEARDRTFLAHHGIQKFLTAYYYGFINISGCHETMKLILSAVFIFPMYLWLSFPALEKGRYLTTPAQKYVGVKTKEFDHTSLFLNPRPQTDEEKAGFIGAIDNFNPAQLAEERVVNDRNAEAYKVGLSRRMYAMWNSPAMKFHLHQVAYYLFLALIAIDVMLPPCRLIGVDIAVFIYALLRWLEVILGGIYGRQIAWTSVKTVVVTEAVLEGVFIILFFLYRIIPFRYDHPLVGRTILSFGVLYYHYRVWDLFYYMGGVIGPSIRLVWRSITQDVFRWMLVTYPLFVGSALVWQAIVTPDWPATGDDWRKMAYRAVFTLFGGFYSDLEYSSACAAVKIDWSTIKQPYKSVPTAVPSARCWIGDYTDPTCNTVTFWSYLFYIHYYFFVLLGSMFMLGCWIFSRFIDEWLDNAIVWKYHRCRLILFYSIKSVIPSPFSALGYLFNILKNLGSKDVKFKTGLKNMVKMEEAIHRNENLSGRIAHSYWSDLALRYYRKQKGDAVTMQDKVESLDSVSSDILEQLSAFAAFLDAKQAQLGRNT